MGKPNPFNTSWRRIATAIYDPPKDAKLYGTVDLQVDKVDDYIKRKRKEGLKVTYTSVMSAIVARSIAFDVPEFNAYVARGTVHPRESVDVLISVLLESDEMSSIKVNRAHAKTMQQIVDEMRDGIQKSRSGDENKTMRQKEVLGSLPWPLRKWAFSALKHLFVRWGLQWKARGLDRNSFGSFILSNIGSLGLDHGYPALFPLSNLSLVILMGRVAKKPIVVNDEVVIRKFITMSACLDHRIVDGLHAGKLFRSMKLRIERIHELDQIPESELKDCPFD
jgi:pyruvate/2-oxoglutarate dehydrogenase complex dihydrolipoamide acyltransferase (E2) component